MTIVIEIPPFLDLVVASLMALWSLVVGRILFRYMFLPWLGRKVAGRLTVWLTPTGRERIILKHYEARRRGRIHQSVWPWRCTDGRCPLL